MERSSSCCGLVCICFVRQFYCILAFSVVQWRMNRLQQVLLSGHQLVIGHQLVVSILDLNVVSRLTLVLHYVCRMYCQRGPRTMV